jgi:sulfite exporter TauE/SafE
MMPIVSIVIGALLIALGVWGYSAAEVKSITALIPAFTGGVLALLGVVGLKESLLKHAMHGAAMIGLIGCLAAASRFIPKVRAGLDTSDVAAMSTGGMTILCAVFVGLCINSFIQARKRRQARETNP